MARRNPEIKTPIVTTQDLIKVLSSLQEKAHGGNADLGIYVNSKLLIVHEVCWNEMGDAIEIRTHRSD